MKIQRMFILVVATIMIAAVLQPARTNAQEASAATNLQRAHPAQAVVDGGGKASQEAKASPFMTKLLPDFPGKEVVMLRLTFPPGYSSPVHRLNADVFAYVQEGSVEMAVNGGEPQGQRSMKAPMTFTRSGATRAKRGRPNCWCSWSWTKVLRSQRQ